MGCLAACGGLSRQGAVESSALRRTGISMLRIAREQAHAPPADSLCRTDEFTANESVANHSFFGDRRLAGLDEVSITVRNTMSVMNSRQCASPSLSIKSALRNALNVYRLDR
jgi:hypothetical protein